MHYERRSVVSRQTNVLLGVHISQLTIARGARACQGSWIHGSVANRLRDGSLKRVQFGRIVTPSRRRVQSAGRVRTAGTAANRRDLRVLFGGLWPGAESHSRQNQE